MLYLYAGAPLHFFNHFFIGISAGLLFLIILTLIGKDVKKFEFIVLLLFWIYSIIPEFIIENGEHEEWTNIFLFHVWLDNLLDKSVLTLAVLFLIAGLLLLIYLKSWRH